MISVEGWTTIRYLHAQGVGSRTIAKKLGLSRTTVRQAIRAEEPPTRTRAKRPNPQLTPFAERIAAMLFEQGFIGTRILRELRAVGYAGSQTALDDYLALIKEQRTRERASARFETGPGEQAHFDWSPYRVPLGGTERRVVVFGLILSYSRRKYYLARLDETQGSAFEALERGLAHFGGAPKRLLVDNAKVFVDDARPMPARRRFGGMSASWSCAGTTRWNRGPARCDGHRPRARSSARFSTWKSTSSRATASRISTR